jgi:hypothetical protein
MYWLYCRYYCTLSWCLPWWTITISLRSDKCQKCEVTRTLAINNGWPAFNIYIYWLYWSFFRMTKHDQSHLTIDATEDFLIPIVFEFSLQIRYHKLATVNFCCLSQRSPENGLWLCVLFMHLFWTERNWNETCVFYLISQHVQTYISYFCLGNSRQDCVIFPTRLWQGIGYLILTANLFVSTERKSSWRCKGCFPLGPRRNFSLSCDFSGGTNYKRQREIPLRAKNSA